MACLSDVVDLDNLARMEAEGLVAVHHHPRRPLVIRNYTHRAQYTPGSWNRETRACRGLITSDDGQVVARPFPKFHNLEEHPRSDLVFSKPFKVTEKVDGSLGVLYPDGDSWAIATRGSFTSEQAIWATAWLKTTYPDFVPPAGVTLLFEIIFQANRIVIDYGDFEGLILLAAIDNETGADAGLPTDWLGRVVKSFDAAGLKPGDIGEKLGIDDGQHEGFVLAFDHPKGQTTRVKVKLDEYKRLHRILTGISSKTVWQYLREGRPLDEILDRVPDEFYAWVRTTSDDLRRKFVAVQAEATAEFKLIEPLAEDRKSFAAMAMVSQHRALLFKLLDGASIDDLIWKELEPAHQVPFKEDHDA